MKKLQILSLGLSVLLLAACGKGGDKAVVSVPQIQIGKAIPNSGTLPAGTYKGTFLANQTYTIGGDITINAGDTLLIQKGVKLNMTNGANIIVNGDLISLGTQASPVTITDPRRVKTTGSSVYNGPNGNGTDSAYVGGWGGIYAGPTSKLVVIKWTHLDFGGAQLKALPFPNSNSLKVGAQYILYFMNPAGVFIMEDSWLYGSPDDATRFYGGTYNIMRNTMEKTGNNGGDGFNAKGSAVGNMAYNLIIGGATNGTKTASDGTTGGECQFAMYNNTYVNDGFRNSPYDGGGAYGARSGSVEIENASRVAAFNNLIVDCNFGVRVAGGPNGKVYLADTTLNANDFIPKTVANYNFYYGDNVAMTDQFVPTNIAQPVVTHPQTNGIPNMSAFVGASYTFGFAYDGTSLIGQNNPMFVNYPLPAPAGFWLTQASVDSYNFRLQAGSPAIGKGTTVSTTYPYLTAGIPIDPNFGSSGITAPGKDMGCYQSNGTGNQH